MNGHKLYYILSGIAYLIQDISISTACKDNDCECIVLSYSRGMERDAYLIMADIFREELAKCGLMVNWALILRQVAHQLRNNPEGQTITITLQTKDFWEDTVTSQIYVSPYTVVLLRPEYLAHPYGLDIYTAHVCARDADDAIVKAQNEAFTVDLKESVIAESPQDYAMLLVFDSHCTPIRNGNFDK